MRIFQGVQLGIAATLLSWAQPALATTLHYDSYSVLNNQTVRIDDDALRFHEAGGSGQITLSGGNLPGGSLATWCIDVSDFLQQSGNFGWNGVLTGDFGNKFNALLTHASKFLASDYDASSALQIAIWKIEYGPSLMVTGPTPAVAMADSWIANVSDSVSDSGPTWKPDATMKVATLRADGSNQDQAYLIPVPEPASLALLAAAMAGLTLVRRARAK